MNTILTTYEAERQKKYLGFAMSKEAKKQLPVGTRYFKCVFLNLEDPFNTDEDEIGYYATFKEAKKACKGFLDVELECFRAGEFVIKEYERVEGKGILRAKYENDIAFKFVKFWESIDN